MNKNDIGNNAGVIWRLLEKYGVMSINEIEKYALMQQTNIILALGWLARENKINFFVKDDVLHVELIHTSFKY